ncbi:hypothetical protein BASA61_007741 [Batrachochytrium salamandrivorans]|nr:hypothetical protein BASA61_007741 [Batrachochytrium salamandrivorans]
MEQTKLNHEGLLTLEQPLIKVPLEQLKRVLRTSQKHWLSLTQIPGEICCSIDASINRLQNLKRKLAEIKSEEDMYIHRTKARLDHLAEMARIPAVDSESYVRWSKTRLARILVDYMLRQGLCISASKLATDSHIQDLVDIELFTQSRKIESALIAKSCNECIQWCNDNRSGLKKIKSTLEFNLRLQEYTELVRNRNIPQAIAYARKYLTPWSDSHLREIQQAMGLLAFSPKTTCKGYRLLFDESQWSRLAAQFRADNHTLNSLTLQPLLHMTLQAGLASLKTPKQSALVLPNGQVYSTLALKEMASRNSGSVRCPLSGVVYHFSETRKAFIL